MSLAKKTKQWVNAQLITEQQQQAILTFEKQRGNRTFWITAFTIAGICIGLGICLLIASNWDKIPPYVRLINDFILLGIFIFATYWNYQAKHPGLTELFTLLSFLLIGGSIGLISQTFQLEGSWNDFALAWALLGLPFILLSRSSFSNIAWLCLLYISPLFHWVKHLLDFLFDDFTALTVLGILGTYFFYEGLCKLAAYTDKYIVLPRATAKSLLIIVYLFIYYIAIRWGLQKITLPSTWGVLLTVFGFLIFRMYLAVRRQQLGSFKRNAILAQLYLFILFASRMGDLWVSGIGMILGGLFILLCIWILRKTTRYIKNMEAFK